MTDAGKFTTIGAAALLGMAAAAVSTAGLAKGEGPMRGGSGPRAEALFDQIDADADGRITAEERESYRLNRFSAADADGDGALTREEMVAARLGAMRDNVDRMVRYMMVEIDGDEDGLVSYEEFGAMGGDRMARRLDADGDGVITRAEAEAAKPGHMRRGRGHGGRGAGFGAEP